VKTLEKRFLEKAKILSTVRDSLKEIGFPTEPERLAAIEHHMECVVSQFFEPKHLEALENFFETETGKLWLDVEIKLLQEIEKITAAHVSYAKGDYILRDLGLLNDTFPDDELDDLPDSQKH